MRLNYINLFKYIDKKNKIYLFIYFILIVIVSLAEIVSLTAIYPYITALIEPNKARKYLENYITLDISNNFLLLIISLGFSIIIIIAVVLRLTLLYISTKLSYRISNDLSGKLFLNILSSDYENQLDRKNNELIDTIIRKSNELNNYINSTLVIAASLTMVVGISIVLLLIDKSITISMFIIFTSLYFLIAIFTSKKIKNNSILISNYSMKSIKILQDSLGSLRDILLDSNQTFYKNFYLQNNLKLKKAQAENSFIGSCPRDILEAFAMLVIVFLCYSKTDDNKSILNLLPIITVCVMGAQKMLPLFQAIYANITILNSISQSVEQCRVYLDKDNIINDKNNLNFDNFKKIKLSNITYKYNGTSKYVLKNINFEIYSGDRILLLGESGSGKSTFIDLIMGLLKPEIGSFFIDEHVVKPYSSGSWKKLVSHVPQNVYFSNASIIENIALGFDLVSIDHQKAKDCARLAGISQFIESLEGGYGSVMGECGEKFSGGQRQRIGIARALYKRSKILIFDEATSALDQETEENVVSTICSLEKDLTIIIVSHRRSLQKYCTKVFEIKNQRMETI